MRVVLTGGGTGGHIYPALAVAREVSRQHPQAAFLYIGSKHGLEAQLVPRTEIPFQSVEISGLKRKLTLDNLKTLWKFLRAVSDSKKMLREFRPDVVIGTGGYVCGPVVYAAAKLGIPTMIHEQNVVPGLTNKFLSRSVTKVAVSFSESLAFFPSAKTVLTGNPRATEVMHGNAEAGRSFLGVDAGKKIVLIFGGSRGARAINEAVVAMVNQLGQFTDTHFVYVTGDVHYEKIHAELQQMGDISTNITVLPFVHNMPDVLAATHVLVGRAGASTLAEVTALGVPSILIPSPYVTNNHQEKNARGLEKVGAAEVIVEQELTGESLLKALSAILADAKRWEQMKKSSLSLGMPHAATEIVDQLTAIARKK
ncbi:UDP-N-acetylglucosamine--N-acetylmuramyl-(pentapeptide) pyrophosphoryl-undecaprenol N-acetylglucosamine transferase 1 [Brevibacillus reuszeri]|uniref:UDP-N-acetylglucosamine--N-acetylmuramyl-(pentapeptide) pyrophosphoryl-undecaprenol N-acetylglucosamine transferase n=1 Tax=Brevibacillus reuszeri TaxID=54915 RepID=A0A0K9YUV0_9BACL|nr:undecaprenyldiphospho-muramoylpentapeptide beta-N-acetylglucosaminyltransferase [Brevibacillus reuszeri]KNB72466.1 UDP-diphospho-muramoylpentapeptide beta-N-acetylglucosaminyltransferase [Brevibacillus reuszeri]MED1860861.1 undecaprenyldiphospho-muramoylpentapeptide beta-N-acetylglucosaminyltransferase [Brevibacillus reuszeri]GED70625.1 UDP-N-acetylglucosamine--N-acetylmuramyl-(pentapeptide) pyrophosphoryl-undecaprenol N-acetylglucosamine transferase 1 [Brevibacillus reuszeri]